MSTDKRIDAYIDKAAAFAKPILEHLRKMVHKACPGVNETIKWGMPYFEYNGSLLCGMASFKQHVAFGFWNSHLLKDVNNVFNKEENAGMGNFGKVSAVKDLPSVKILSAYIKEAMLLIDAGNFKTKPVADPGKALKVPDYFQKALNKNKAAKTVFDNFAPSHRKEYIKWLEEAKTETTREKRLNTAMEWIAEGKGQNWRYMQKK